MSERFKKKKTTQNLLTFRFAAGGAGERLRPDPLPGRLHQGGPRHEDQPDRGARPGETRSRNAANFNRIKMADAKVVVAETRGLFFNAIKRGGRRGPPRPRHGKRGKCVIKTNLIWRKSFPK